MHWKNANGPICLRFCEHLNIVNAMQDANADSGIVVIESDNFTKVIRCPANMHGLNSLVSF